MRTLLRSLLLLLVVAAALPAQTARRAAAPQIVQSARRDAPPPAPRAATQPPLSENELRARVSAHKADFDYLLGDWRFRGVSKQWGAFEGYWSAVRLPGDAQVLDEYRVVGDSGQTYYVTSTVRSYDALRDEWDLVSIGEPNGLRDVGTGRRVGEEVHIEQSFGTGLPQPHRLRIRYHDITADHFRWTADCSADGGRTWVQDCQHLEVTRIGGARPPAPLTPPRAPSAPRP